MQAAGEGEGKEKYKQDRVKIVRYSDCDYRIYELNDVL